MLASKKAPTASLPRTPVPPGFVNASPIGSSMTISSAISASQPSLSPACTQRHDDSDATMTGVFSTVSCDISLLLLDGTGGAGAVLGGLADQSEPGAVTRGMDSRVGQGCDELFVQ